MTSTLNLPKTLEKFRHLIDDVSDERGMGQGYWVYLKAGLINPWTETHCVHEDTIKECAEQLKIVKPCQCADCTNP